MVEQPRLNKSHRIRVSQHINMYYEMQEYILSTQYVQMQLLQIILLEQRVFHKYTT